MIYLLVAFVAFGLLFGFIVSTVKVTHSILALFILNNNLCWILSFIPLILILIGLVIDMTNAIVVDLHLFIIVLLTKLVCFIIEKVFKVEVNEFIPIGIGVLLTVIVLCRGYYLAYHVVQTNYEVFTNKNIESDQYRIVQVSDSHLGTTMSGKKFGEYMDRINELNPDIVVVTGDFIDDNTSLNDLNDGAKGLGKLNTKQGVYFIYGNHDKGYYSNKDEALRTALKENNVTILEDEIIDLNDSFILIGRKDSDRKEISELTKDLDENKFWVVLNHQPTDYDNETKSKVDLVLSGHTHGGQLIPLGQLSVLLGVNDKYYGMEKRGNTTFIVNSGISDWAMKFKTGTVSEYVVIDIKK